MKARTFIVGNKFNRFKSKPAKNPITPEQEARFIRVDNECGDDILPGASDL